MAPKPAVTESEDMKTRQLVITAVGLALVAFSPMTRADSRHGGGGFRGGGFGGMHFGGGGTARPNSASFGTRSRGGSLGYRAPRYALPRGHFASIAPGHSFSSAEIHRSEIRPASGAAHFLGAANIGTRGAVRGSIARSAYPNRAGNHGETTLGSGASRTVRGGLNGLTSHTSETHTANWRGNWDRKHAHYAHNRFFVYDGGFWYGLDDGLFPWDYLPYYADDYYPYDYYTDDSTVPVNSVDLVADPTVEAVQSLLAQLGYYDGPLDGIFGPATRDAVAQYQIAKQLNVTGSLSPDTLQSLGLPQAAQS